MEGPSQGDSGMFTEKLKVYAFPYMGIFAKMGFAHFEINQIIHLLRMTNKVVFFQSQLFARIICAI